MTLLAELRVLSALAYLFPAGGLGPLFSPSHVGVLLFMLQVGWELDLSRLRRMGRVVVLTSNISILVPFLGGVGLALFCIRGCRTLLSQFPISRYLWALR